MSKERLLAFTDGVVAIIITVMVLELKPPDGAGLAGLVSAIPTFLNYLLSFIFVAIYWNNHHHLMSAVKRIDGSVLWANMHLLFWLSLIPFASAWMGRSPLAVLPTATFGALLFCCAIAYTVLVIRLIYAEGAGSEISGRIGKDNKGKASLLIYVAAMGLAFVQPGLADALYVLVACIWLIPDKRFAQEYPED